MNKRSLYNFKLFKEILRIRKIELKISKEYSKGEIRCPVHLSIGQEAIPVGICSNLKKSDQIVSSHRSHAHYLAKGGSLKSMISEIFGKETGCTKGKGGSMHLTDLNAGIVASVPIVASTIPIGTGIAWANKLKKNSKIVTIFFGDGATEEGVFQESIDFASLHNLKVLFVCENNFYSVYSSLKRRQSKKRNIINLAKSLGIKAYKINGNDVQKIHKSSKKIINNIRKSSRATLILLNTYRWLEHCGPNNDDNLNYRSRKEINYWINKCPLKKIKKKLKQKKIINKLILEKLNNKIDKEINFAFEFARKSKFPKKIELNKDIYAI